MSSKKSLNRKSCTYNRNLLSSFNKEKLNRTTIITCNEDNKPNEDISQILKKIPLNNLNDYYNIETNLFKKRIEKLNLKFYFICDSLLNENTADICENLIYPYNKLFLILFKEISLYIEEITRLNMQLKSKTKNETYYLQKINDLKQKEKEFLQNKLLVKTLQRTNKLLEKNNNKLKNDIEKLNKKIISSNNKASKKITDKSFLTSNKKKHKLSSEYNTDDHTTIFSSESYSKKLDKSSLNFMKKHYESRISNVSLYSRNTNMSFMTNNNFVEFNMNNNEFLNFGIKQCDEEINYLNDLENLFIEGLNKVQKNKVINDKGRNRKKINNKLENELENSFIKRTPIKTSKESKYINYCNSSGKRRLPKNKNNWRCMIDNDFSSVIN